MPTPAKLESALSPEEVRDFCARLAATPGGTALRVIIAEARKHGVILSTHSAATFRDGPLAAALAGLHDASAQAARVDEVAQDGRDLAGAASALLVRQLFARVRDGAALQPRDLEQLSRVLGRLQAGIGRARHLEFQLRALQGRLAQREAQLALARERFRRQSSPGVAEAIERLRAKCAGSEQALKHLDEALAHVFEVRPHDRDLAPLKDAVAQRRHIRKSQGPEQSLLWRIRNQAKLRQAPSDYLPPALVKPPAPPAPPAPGSPPPQSA